MPTTTTRTNEVTDIIRDNTLGIVDEVAKVQPQFAQSISNLQLDNIQTERSMIQIAFANQKELGFVLNSLKCNTQYNRLQDNLQK
jgi:urease accessory protein UreE